ncbi:MAG TPA: 3-phosphoshikimate 1-carboxyvinyltransferase [Spirochaetota bacterium]|nr:3-phosphoshikimate 1-carboxyvinyltransferase [Spirochaetota bacterium]
MNHIVNPSRIGGAVSIPGSKSHTIRALALGLLADGESVIRKPLESSDTLSCLAMVERFGARVTREGGIWRLRGTGPIPALPDDVIDTGNSGTTLYIGLGIASLLGGATVFTGDGQIRSRPADGLLGAINDLGGRAFSTRGNGKPPLVIEGPVRGGETSIEAVTSQYLTSLLIALPLAGADSVINVPLLNEAPYVTMTLRWLERLGARVEADDRYRRFRVPGRQSYRPFDEEIAADFSSATFFLVAAAVTGCELELRGLDFTDPQGDKEVVNILKAMGAEVAIGERSIRIRGGKLTGGVFDLNAIPDALPALSVAACFAEGETRLVNVPQARLKETDRIAVMCRELSKMGARVEELPDGLIVKRSALKGTAVDGHGDHRVVMALSVAGLAAEGTTTVGTAESVSVTFPGFTGLMRSAGADILATKE